MKFTYQPRGVCSRKIDLSIEDGVVKAVSFTGGCSGNTQGVAALCVGRKPEELIPLLKGIRCGMKTTSCPDQLANACLLYTSRCALFVLRRRRVI